MSEIYHRLNYSNDDIAAKDKNQIKFSVDIVDYKDLSIVRKYDMSYSESGVQIFQIIRRERCGILCLVIKIDRTNYRTQFDKDLPFDSELAVRILPDDAECALFVIESFMTQEGVIGERDMTQGEIEAEVAAKKEGQERRRKLAEKKRIDDLNRSWLDSLEEDEEEEEDSYEKFAPPRKVPVYGPISRLENIISAYSLNRQAFPQANLFQTTSLQYHKHELQFSIHADAIDKLVRQWYESNDQLNIYEFKCKTIRNNYLNYIRSQEIDDEPDHEREAWEELTDGQNGEWEDWHD